MTNGRGLLRVRLGDWKMRGAVWGLLLVSMLGLAHGAHAYGGLTTGFSSDVKLTGGTPGAQSEWIGRAVVEGAGLVRVNVPWLLVAPVKRPARFNPSKPGSAGYQWASIDTTVRDLSARGLTVLLTLYGAPTWAEGPGRPSTAGAGTWRPNATQFGAFARAAARRYSGHYPDPTDLRRFLPRVRYWQAWNEPNLDFYLAPQWQRIGAGYVAVSPVVYRSLLNAFYAAVKQVARSNFVVMGGTAPYGQPPGGVQMRPLAFYRAVFCLAPACHGVARLDAVDNHPYEVVAPPTHHALWSDDVAVPDVWKISRTVDAAVRQGRVVPRGHKQTWVTEITWDSSPPDPGGFPIATQARYVELAMYLLWQQGVHTILWLQIGDASPGSGLAGLFESGGMFYWSGRPKPAATALRFPLVAHRLRSDRVQVWGRAPAGGVLAISREHAGRWFRVARFHVRRHQVFLKALQLRGPLVLQAQVGNETSLPWIQGP
jgi:hypothetical protein